MYNDKSVPQLSTTRLPRVIFYHIAGWSFYAALLRATLRVLPVRPSVRLSVCPVRVLLTREQKSVENPKMAWTFPRAVVVNRCANFELERSKVEGQGQGQG